MTLVQSLLRTSLFTGLYVLATYAGRMTVMDSANLSLVWPAAGVSAVWFLAQHRSRWRALDAVALAGVTMVVNTATGVPAALGAFFVVANLAQAWIFTYLFRRWLPHVWGGGGTRPLARLNELWRLIGAAFVATASGALIGPTGIWVTTGVYSVPATAVWLTRNTVSILLIGAAGIRVGQLLHTFFLHGTAGWWGRLHRSWSATSPRRRGEYLAVTVLSAVSYWLVFGLDHGLPLAFSVLVMTVWAALRLHTGFVITHDLVFGSVAVWFTLNGTGVFADIASPLAQALVAQLFVGMIAVVGLALALGRDEREALVADLHRERQAAADQAALMSTIVDSMAEGLTVVDEQGRFLLRNPAVRELLGGVAGDSEAFAEPGHYGLFHPDGTDLAPDEMPYRRALTGQVVHDMDILVRNPGVPEGRILNVSSIALPGSLQGSRCAITVFHDVTAERRHRDELTAFAGVVAHDLVNPLSTVEGWTDALAETFADHPGHPAAAEAADGTARIRRATLRMRTLIDDLLAYTTARDAAIAPTTVDLDAVVGDIVSARVDQAQSSGAPVPVFRVGALHTVYADPALTRQLLENLISNAIKYTAPGVVPEISIASETADDLVAVSLTDNGIGIPTGQHHGIFDNFARAHRSAGYTGTGLGLGICKRIVERHGGTISASDNPGGRGSRFTFTLPAHRGAIAGADSPAVSPPAPPRADAVGALPGVPRAPVGTAGPGSRPPADLPAPLPALKPGDTFAHAAQLVLDYLHAHLPLAFWAVTKVENGRQVYLYLDAYNGYGLRQGDSHPWEDSYCVHMAAGRAPAVAPDTQAVPAYADAAINDVLDIGCYAGAPITEPGGSLFGAICGLDPQTRSDDPRLAAAEPLLVLLGQLLTTALAAEHARSRDAAPPGPSRGTPRQASGV
ncbi:MAG TPA: ATP-binding protein [Pilimelia sp.]|nr:ATP-binding protein [Pilimelia sp.]